MKMKELIDEIYEMSTGERFENSYSNRIRLQKIVYLARLLGLKLRYDTIWYYRGPYSPRFAVEYAYDKITDGTDLTLDDAKNISNKIKSLVNEDTTERNLELYASVAYILKEKPARTEDDVVFIMKEKKPDFLEKEVREAYGKLQVDFITNQNNS